MERCNVPQKKKKKRDLQTVNEVANVKKTGTSKESDDKLSVSSKTYAYIAPETISKIAESVGLPSLSEDIAINLAEDVSYKLQEIISASCTIMRCCKRRRLQTSDISEALRVADTPPIFGHSVNNPFNFISVPEAEVFVGEDNEVDLSSVALGSTSFTQPKPSYLAISWPILGSMLKTGREKSIGKSIEKSQHSISTQSKIIPVNGEIKKEKLDDLALYENSVHADTLHSSGNLYLVSKNIKEQEFNLKEILHQNSEEEVQLSSAQLSYFHTMSNCLLRGSKCHFQQAIQDLRTNEKLGVVVAPLLNLLALTVYHVPRQFGTLMRVLETLDALLINHYANPSFSIAVNRIVNALLAISSDQNVIPSDDFLLRRKAAHLLARILAEWSVEEQHVDELLSRVALVLGDSREPIQSQYGALVIFQSLGKPVLQAWVLPLLVKYLPQLEQKLKLPSLSMALQIEEIRGVLLDIVELLNCDTNTISHPSKSTISQQLKAMAQLDILLYEYIGDAVCARRLPTLECFRQLKKKRAHSDRSSKGCLRDLKQRTPTSNLFSIHFHGNSLGTSLRRSIQPGVFQDVPYLTPSVRKEINFRFAGANPVPKERLKRKVLDRTHVQFVDHIHGPLHSLYQRQYPMVGHTLQSRLASRNVACYNLKTTL